MSSVPFENRTHLFRPVYHGSTRVCLLRSRSLSTTCETLTRRFSKMMRESFDEKRTTRRYVTILRFFVFHYPLVLFLFFFRARDVVDTRFYGFGLRGFQSLIWDSVHLNFYSSSIHPGWSYRSREQSMRHCCFLLIYLNIISSFYNI